MSREMYGRTDMAFLKSAMAVGRGARDVYGCLHIRNGWIGTTDGHRAHRVKQIVVNGPDLSLIPDGAIDLDALTISALALPVFNAVFDKMPPANYEIKTYEDRKRVLALCEASKAYAKGMREKTPVVQLATSGQTGKDEVFLNSLFLIQALLGLDLDGDGFPLLVTVTSGEAPVKFVQGRREAVVMPMKLDRPTLFDVSMCLSRISEVMGKAPNGDPATIVPVPGPLKERPSDPKMAIDEKTVLV